MAVKAREIRERLRGRVDPEVLFVLEQLAEHQNVLREQIMELAQSVDGCINILNQVTQIAVNMKQVTDTLQGKESFDDLDPEDLN